MTINDKMIRAYVMVEVYLRALIEYLAERHARRMLSPKRGAAMVEYAVLAALIVVGTITATQLLGTSIGQVFTRIRNRIANLG